MLKRVLQFTQVVPLDEVDAVFYAVFEVYAGKW
jgi:hypothetical protein